jgi:hypothetical protein
MSTPTVEKSSTRRASDVAGRSPYGTMLSISVVSAGGSTLLAFLTSRCATCSTFWDALASRGFRAPSGARIVVVTKGEEAESSTSLRELAPPDVPVVMSSDAWEAYGVTVAPYFAYVHGDSATVVDEVAPDSWDDVVSMSDRALVRTGRLTTRP